MFLGLGDLNIAKITPQFVIWQKWKELFLHKYEGQLPDRDNK